MRDNFSKQTIAEIAKGVGYRCSNPNCARATVGANASQDGTISIGVAAHVCAASPGGPRYSAVQTPAMRRGKDNGIWLCQDCGKLVDADPKEFTVEVLTKWKREAQSRAFRELAAPRSSAQVSEAVRVKLIIASENAVTGDAGYEEVFERVRAAAKADLATYKQGATWKFDPIELTLRLDNDKEAPPFSISTLPVAVEIAPEVTIIAPAGTGKTTTMLQLADHTFAAKSLVPLYFRLGDWSAGQEKLFESLNQRSAFKDIELDRIFHLAERGRLLLLLDGWNELDPAARRRLRVELDRIRREFPDVRIVITTRRQMLDVPIVGPRIAIEALSEGQQMAIGKAKWGAVGERIVDEAWRTPGVRELIAIPLYLSSLLTSGTTGSKPGTKEEVLRLFVEQHESSRDHAEALQATLFNSHSAILTAFASQLNVSSSTTMSEKDARLLVATTLEKLRTQGQLTGDIQPTSVLEALVSHHNLVRSSDGNATFSFQHQQFQEWYASHEVVRLMRESAYGDLSAQSELRIRVLDQRSWEESILFGSERLSREAGGSETVAHTVRLALTIDPMLAAEMIYRASDSVWELVKADMLALVTKWHRAGTVDRAVRFMVITGRPEFEPYVWPLASSTNLQTQLPTLRTAPRFRPSVLGSNLKSKIAALPDATREHLLALIASESGIDGLDLATDLAIADPSPRVQREVIQHLLFRRADRHAEKVLEKAHDETWALIAKDGYADEVSDPRLAQRLRAEVEKAVAKATEPAERLRWLLDQPTDHPGRDGGISSAIGDEKFSVKGEGGTSPLYYAQQRAPAAVLAGIRQRVESGLDLPYHVGEFLEKMEVVDDGPIVDAMLDARRKSWDAEAIAVLAGAKTVGVLIDRYIAAGRALKPSRNDRAQRDQYQRLRSQIGATRDPQFVAAIMAHAESKDLELISSLAELVHLHGNKAGSKEVIAVDAKQKSKVISLLKTWVETVLSSPTAKRYDLNEVANAIGRFGFGELLPDLKRLLNEDLARLSKAIAGRADAVRRGDIEASSDAAMRYGNQYRAAFASIGGSEVAAIAAEYLEDHVFGFDAALILKAISDKALDVPEPDFHRRWPWFEDVPSARLARLASPAPEPANDLARPIFAAIDRLAKPTHDKDSQLLAIQLARIALAMPHSNQDEIVQRTLALPQPLRTKRELLAAVALDGQILDVGIVMAAIDEWLASDTKDAWHKRQNTWEIEPWLELLPFTTQPEAVIDGLSRVKEFYGTSYRQDWGRVLAAVAAVPDAAGERLLAKFARAHADIVRNYEWVITLLKRDTPSAMLLCVDLFIEGVLGKIGGSSDLWSIGRELAASVSRFPQAKADLAQRYAKVANGPGQALLERVFSEIGGEENLIAMVKTYAASGRRYDGNIDGAVRATALRHEPVQDSSNAFYTYPAPVASVRKSLFALLRGTQSEAALARQCLTTFDVLRDEHGIAPTDPRHPDITANAAWPLEAGPQQHP